MRRQAARQAVLGSLSDKDVIASQTAVSDIIIHTATADDLPSVHAILERGPRTHPARNCTNWVDDVLAEARELAEHQVKGQKSYGVRWFHNAGRIMK